jgi:hypothetical protein
MGAKLNRAALIALLLLAGCGEASRRPDDAGALPIVPTMAPALTRPAPTPPLETALAPTSAALAPTSVAPATQGVPASELTPTFSTYREPRGVFTIDVPANWRTTPLANGIGITSLAYNATAITSLSLSWQADQLTPTAMAQIAEQYKTRLLEGYLTKNLDLSGVQQDQHYVLSGTATLTGTPTTIEISLEQTPGGTIVLQSWLVPTELWPEFQRIFQQPIQASLKIDDAAARLVVSP